MTDVVLGPKAREEGAEAQLLKKSLAGAGYLRVDDDWQLVRTRWKDDPQIIKTRHDSLTASTKAMTENASGGPLSKNSQLVDIRGYTNPYSPSLPPLRFARGWKVRRA